MTVKQSEVQVSGKLCPPLHTNLTHAYTYIYACSFSAFLLNNSNSQSPKQDRYRQLQVGQNGKNKRNWNQTFIKRNWKPKERHLVHDWSVYDKIIVCQSHTHILSKHWKQVYCSVRNTSARHSLTSHILCSCLCLNKWQCVVSLQGWLLKMLQI